MVVDTSAPITKQIDAFLPAIYQSYAWGLLYRCVVIVRELLGPILIN